MEGVDIFIIRELGTQRHAQEPLVINKNQFKSREEEDQHFRKIFNELRLKYPKERYEIVFGGADSLEDFYRGYARYRPRERKQ